jgi:hypothetical protein
VLSHLTDHRFRTICRSYSLHTASLATLEDQKAILCCSKISEPAACFIVRPFHRLKNSLTAGDNPTSPAGTYLLLSSHQITVWEDNARPQQPRLLHSHSLSNCFRRAPRRRSKRINSFLPSCLYYDVGHFLRNDYTLAKGALN